MVRVTSLLVKAGSGVGFSFRVRARTEMEIRCVKGMFRLKLISSGKNSGFKGLIHRPEEAMDIQTEWIFIVSWCTYPRTVTFIHQQVSFHLAIPPSPLLRLERRFPGLHDVTSFIVKHLSMKLLILQCLFSVGCGLYNYALTSITLGNANICHV